MFYSYLLFWCSFLPQDPMAGYFWNKLLTYLLTYLHWQVLISDWIDHHMLIGFPPPQTCSWGPAIKEVRVPLYFLVITGIGKQKRELTFQILGVGRVGYIYETTTKQKASRPDSSAV